MKNVRIGGALGFWGDRRDAILDILNGGPLDYVMMDYLSEVTLSILQKQRLKNPQMGYAHDFVSTIKPALKLIVEKRVKLITNAGGLNPAACAQALMAMAKAEGFGQLKIGVVQGDDLFSLIEKKGADKFDFFHMETGASQNLIPGKILSANAYLGAFPIARALSMGADIVITGRVNDAALALGPLIYEFGWNENDLDLLASGTIAGHLLECGGQATGGNFNGGWQSVPDLAHLGFPIAEVSEDGSFVMTIHPGFGGLVTPAVLKEQLLYEVGDPSKYLVADVTCDLTDLEMEDLGLNRVLIKSVRGGPAPIQYKVSVCYEGGYKVSGGLIYTWPNCVAKARAGGELFLGRLKKLGLKFKDHRFSILGYDGVHGLMSRKVEDPDEVYMRLSFLVDDLPTAEKIARELTTHVLCGIPSACSLDGGRATPQKQILHWPSLIPKSMIESKISVIDSATWEGVTLEASTMTTATVGAAITEPTITEPATNEPVLGKPAPTRRAVI